MERHSRKMSSQPAVVALAILVSRHCWVRFPATALTSGPAVWAGIRLAGPGSTFGYAVGNVFRKIHIPPFRTSTRW